MEVATLVGEEAMAEAVGEDVKVKSSVMERLFEGDWTFEARGSGSLEAWGVLLCTRSTPGECE